MHFSRIQLGKEHRTRGCVLADDADDAKFRNAAPQVGLDSDYKSRAVITWSVCRGQEPGEPGCAEYERARIVSPRSWDVNHPSEWTPTDKE